MAEKNESQQFRDELASELKKSPKEKREELLDKAKEDPEYWQARTEKLQERQNEEEIDDGFGVLLKKKTLYHGSGVSGIEKFNKAEEDTVGSGIYFTSEAKDAIGYARLRAERERKRNDDQKNENAKPVIYESSVENMKLLDCRKDENVKKVLKGFRAVELQKLLHGTDLDWLKSASLHRVIDNIDTGNTGAKNLKTAVWNDNQGFSDYVKSIGYEGLITFEGGEGSQGNHDTYLIFESDKIKINQEHNISTE